MLRFAEAEHDCDPRLYHEYLKVCRETCDFQRLNEARLSEGIRQVWDFIKEMAQKFSYRIRDLVQAFKNAEIFKFFSSFKFNFRNVAEAFRLVYKLAKDISGFLPQKTAALLLKAKNRLPAGVQDKIKNGILRIDRFLKSKGRLGYVIFSCFMIWIYLEAGLTGNVSYDFDAGDVIDAMRGRLTFAEFFLGDGGDFTNRDGSVSLALEYLALIGLGKIGYGGVLPYAQFSNGVFLAGSLLQYFAKEFGARITKGKNTGDDMDAAQAAFA